MSVMSMIARLTLFVCLSAAVCAAAGPTPAPLGSGQQVQQVDGEVGGYRGHLAVGQRAEPKTLNPVTATGALSRQVIGRRDAELISINRLSQSTEPVLAESCTTSPHGRIFTRKLRCGIRFWNGEPFDADVVVFFFKVYVDEDDGSLQRDLLIIDGTPLAHHPLWNAHPLQLRTSAQGAERAGVR
jgi:ABC-type transport system substrate-binding protein